MCSARSLWLQVHVHVHVQCVCILNVQLTRLDDSWYRFDLQPRLANVLFIELRDEGDVDGPTPSVGHNQSLLMRNHEPNISELKLWEGGREGGGGVRERLIYKQEVIIQSLLVVPTSVLLRSTWGSVSFSSLSSLQVISSSTSFSFFVSTTRT